MTVPYTDIKQRFWLDRFLPSAAIPYTRLARLDRPVGWWLLLFPCWWGTALAAPHYPPVGLFILFWIGAVAMRGAGCTLNDILDREVDAQVERTRGRPLPSGQVSLTQAILFMLVLTAIGGIVLMSLKPVAILLGLAILLVVCSYPLMKRVTFWPQFFLGLNFNWGALVGWAAVTGWVGSPALLLYLGGIAWTLGYDTIYAHQDKKDDVRIGVKSTALRFGSDSKLWIAMFYAIATLCFGLALALAGSGFWGYPGLILAACHFFWQVFGWAPDDPADCLKRFKSNRTVGWFVLIACLGTGM